MSAEDDPHIAYSRLLSYFLGVGNEAPKPIPHPDRAVNDMMRGREASLRRASVLLPVTRPTQREESQLVLTVRSENLRSHAGQISLPGGAEEPRDESPVVTALRETEEEVGIARDNVEVLGLLGHMALPSGFIITPVVGLIDHGLEYRACPAEVADIFQVPLSLVMDPKAYENTKHKVGEQYHSTLELYFEDYRIWGATAAMLFHLACELSTREEIRDF